MLDFKKPIENLGYGLRPYGLPLNPIQILWRHVRLLNIIGSLSTFIKDLKLEA